MSDIRIKDIGKDISLTPIEIVMRDDKPELVSEPNSNIIINLHPTEGTHWVLVIRREGGPVYYIDSFGVETPPLFLEEYVDLGANEKIQQYDESYCGAYCLYMIYLIDRGFRIKSALNILVNQCKYPGIYNECSCLSCNVNDKVNVNDNVIDNDNVNDNVNDNDKDIDSVKDNVNDKDIDLRSSFANNVEDNDNDKDINNVKDNVNDKDIDLRSSFANNVDVNDNDKDNDNVDDNDYVNGNDNDSVNDNDNDKDNFIYLFGEKHQRAKPKNKECLSNNISVNINDDLYSVLNDDGIITQAAFPDNFRCIISSPSECGKTFLLKKLILASIYFDKLYIIGPTDDQYHGIERINPKTDVEFIKDIKDLPSPDKLPKDLKKLMIFDDVRAKEPVINEYFCRGRHNNCNMIYLIQNLFSLDRQNVRENCNLFILFEQRGKVLISIYQDFFNNIELSYNDFANICNKVWKEPYNYIVFDITKNKNINGKLRINWDRKVL